MAILKGGKIVRMRRWMFMLIGAALVWFTSYAHQPRQAGSNAEATCDCN